DAFGCRSSNDSLNTFMSTPVVFLKASTIAMNAWSSASTKRFQRITVSLAPASGFQGAACAHALAHSSSAGPARAAVAVSAVLPRTRVRRVKVAMVVSSIAMVRRSAFVLLLHRKGARDAGLA